MAKRKNSVFHGGRVILFVLLVLLSFIMTLAYQEMLKPAANNPKRFISMRFHRPGRKIVVCLGDNILRGQISFNVVDYLARKPELQEFQFINAGINGDSTYNLLQRLDQVISCKPAYIIILIGTNDLLGSRYPGFAKYYQWVKQLPRKPDSDWFTLNLRQIVEILNKKTRAEILLISIPMLGEAVNSDANREVARYNRIVKTIATVEGIHYLSIYDQQAKYLLGSQRTSAPEFENNGKQIAQAAIDCLLFKKNLDSIAAANGYLLHTDGINLNTRGGMMAAEQISEYLLINR